MLDKNGKQQIDLFKKRREYGRNLFSNAIAGRLNFKEKILPKELKKKDFVKIAKDVESGIIVLKREFPKIEKEYTKFCNEIQIKKQTLAKENKKLNKEKNNVLKRYEDLYYKLENCDLEILELDYNRQKYLVLQQQLEIDKKNQTQQIQKNIKDKEQELYNKIEQLQQLQSEQNYFVEDVKEQERTVSENTALLKYYRNELKNNKDELKKLKKDRKTIMQQLDSIRQNKIERYNIISSCAYKPKNNNTIKDLFADINKKYNPKLGEWNEKQNKIDLEIMQVDYDCIQSKNMIGKLLKDSVPILHNIEAIKERLGHIETEKQHLNNEIATIERDIMLSKQQRDKINNDYKKQSKGYQSNIDEINKILTEKQSIFYRLEKQHERFIDLNTKRVEHINQQIWNNNTQITQLDEKINERTKKYNNIKNAYNRAFGLYNKQNKQINNNNNVIVKKYLPKYR